MTGNSNTLQVLGLITARGGSKGIPRKNITLLCGKPLIAYTIEAADKSKLLTRTIVSTDDQEIAEVARSFGADVPFLRPPALATDTATSIDVVQHALMWLREQNGQEYDAVMILQPTSPFRSIEDIDACIQKMIDTGADSVMSMAEVTDFSLQKLKSIEDDRISPLVEPEGTTSTPRHDLKKVYKRNCAIYLTAAHTLADGDLFGNDSRAYIMPAERSVDINTPIDFSFAEFLMSRRTTQ